LDRLVEYLHHIDTVLVGDFPKRSNNVPKACELEGADEVNSLIEASVRLIRPGRASREITKKWRVLLEPVVSKISYS